MVKINYFLKNYFGDKGFLVQLPSFFEGTGLGIYVGRKMVKIHHGKIWAESDGINKGSKFIVELPVTWAE